MPSWMFRAATPGDWSQVATLLTSAQLPLAGVEERLEDFVLALSEGVLVGCAAPERYGHSGLLRSVAVSPVLRGQGLGQALVDRVLECAAAGGLDAVALLTISATGFFPRFGFRVVERSQVPVAVQESVEFTNACPASATAMLLELRRSQP